MQRVYWASVALLAVAACETGLSEEQCLNADVRTIGFEDGRNGSTAGRFLDRAEQCGRYGVTLDAVLYEEGRQEGLRIFCTPEGALEAGLRERGDIEQCPIDDPLIRDAYYAGRRVADARDDLNRAERHYDSLLSTIDSAERGIAKSRRQLQNEPVEKQRQELARRIERYRRQRRDAERQLSSARFDIDRAYDRLRRAEDDLARVRAQIASRRARERDARVDPYADENDVTIDTSDDNTGATLPDEAPGIPTEPEIPEIADEAEDTDDPAAGKPEAESGDAPLETPLPPRAPVKGTPAKDFPPLLDGGAR